MSTSKIPFFNMSTRFWGLVHLAGILAIVFILYQYDWFIILNSIGINVLWCFLLLPLNIFLEVIKMREASTLPILESFKVVIRGYLGQLISPVGPGILFGRLIYLPSQKTGSVISASIISSVCQTLVTCAAGFFAFVFLFKNNQLVLIEMNPNEFIGLVFSAIIILLILTIGFIIYSKNIIGTQLNKILMELKSPSGTLWFRQLGLSFLRYLLYTLQFMILLSPFYTGSWWLLCVPVACVFLLQSLVNLPTYGMLLVRTGASSLIFTQCGMEASHAIGASGLLFIINKVIPALVGGLLILIDFRTHFLNKLFTTT